jgi:hypothetical protein
MADQTIVKVLGLIKDLKILIHRIPYAMTFTIIQSSVLDSSYSMLLGHPWLKDAKVSHDWGNNIITIKGTDIVITIFVIKKVGAPTKHPKMLVCYDFHFGISNKEEDLIFATKPGLFSIGTIVVLTFVWSNQPAKLITLTCLNSIEYVYVHVELMSILPISFNIHVKPIFVLPIKINIPLHTFKQHLLKSFFQLEVEEMEIDETPTHIRVQNLHIVGWIVTKNGGGRQ